MLATYDGIQRVVITQGRRGFQLFINGNLQFSSTDEYIYHEALTHPLICSCEVPVVKSVAILGGGDGLAAREVLRHESIESVVVVDYDSTMTDLAINDPAMRALNMQSFHDARVQIVTADAIKWLAESETRFDVVIVDFPDPQSSDYAELYTQPVFDAVRRRLAVDGQFVVQATSRKQCPLSYSCIARTIETADLHTVGYDVTMRSFGEWSFIIGRQTKAPARLMRELPKGLRFLTPSNMQHFLHVQSHSVPVQVNTKGSGVLFKYFDEEWRKWVSQLRQRPRSG